MKYNILGFPKKYSLNKDIYNNLLSSKVITQRQIDFLKENVKEVEIQYAIRFKDNSEIMVIRAEIIKGGIIVKREVANIIAKAIPYPILVLINKQHLAKLFTFEYKKNKRKEGWLTVERIYSSCEIGIYDYNMISTPLLEELRIFTESEPAQEVYARWCGLIERSYIDYVVTYGDESEVEKMLDIEMKYVAESMGFSNENDSSKE